MAEVTAKITLLADEYWEARGHDLAAQVATWIENYFGPRCPDVETECACCRAWQGYDSLFKELESTP